MSLVITQRPYQTIEGVVSKWNAVGNPVLYKMQREDFTFTLINNSGGNVQLQFSGVNVSASFAVGNIIYVQSVNGVYDFTAEVTASSFSTNTLVTVDYDYTSSAASGGFTNNATLRPSYRVEVEAYNIGDEQIGESFVYSPTTKGALTIDVASIIRSQLIADNEADLTGEDETFEDTAVYTGFYIKYTEVWNGSAESQVSDLTDNAGNEFFGLLGAMQIPSLYGGNIYEYLITGIMKITDITITTAEILTGNGSPVTIVAAPGAGKIIFPVAFFDSLDYNSIAYATNVDYHYEINGVDVTGTISTMLDAAADKVSINKVQDIRTLTDLVNKALVWKVNTGNPTAGNSPLYSKVLYTIIDFT